MIVDDETFYCLMTSSHTPAREGKPDLRVNSTLTYGVGHNALSLVLEFTGENRGHDAGSGTGQNDVVRCVAVQFTKHLLLQVSVLWNAFL